MYFNLQDELEKLTDVERYALCCSIIGKDKTDELLSKRGVRARIMIKKLSIKIKRWWGNDKGRSDRNT